MELASPLILNETFSIIFKHRDFFSGQTGAVPTEIKSDPTPKVKDVMFSSLRNNCDADSSDNDDW